jgi:hypothetical protein
MFGNSGGPQFTNSQFPSVRLLVLQILLVDQLGAWIDRIPYISEAGHVVDAKTHWILVDKCAQLSGATFVRTRVAFFGAQEFRA